MTPSDKQAFVANIEKQHGRRLRRFIASRLRSAAVDAADLAQEVFLRLLRIDHHETIRSTEAYRSRLPFMFCTNTRCAARRRRKPSRSRR